MAIKTRDEILEMVRARMGDDHSDEALAFVEDISDTLTEMDKNASNGINWKKKFEDNDKAWRQKYRDRFFSGTPVPEEVEEPEVEKPKKLTFENLFKEG